MNKKHFLLIAAVIILVSAVFLRVKTRLESQDSLSKIEKSTVSSEAFIKDNASSEIRAIVDSEFPVVENVKVLISNPQAGQLITSPLLIQGRISGNWFFEASLPIKLVDNNGSIIAEHYALADGDWMTTELVDFSGILEFDLNSVIPDNGYLIIAKDNPSGLPEHDGAIRMPVRFR